MGIRLETTTEKETQVKKDKTVIDYISLHNHTHFSILNSLISPEDLFNKAKDLGQRAIAITDNGSLASIWQAFQISKKIGIKLIVGCEMYFVNDASNKEDKFRRIILISKIK